MSCSSNRNRLVGSCISTLVSRTKSLLAMRRRVAGPGRAGLADLRATRVRGAGRVLRSTMGLLGGVACSVVGRADAAVMLARALGEHKHWYPGHRPTGTGC